MKHEIVVSYKKRNKEIVGQDAGQLDTQSQKLRETILDSRR